MTARLLRTGMTVSALAAALAVAACGPPPVKTAPAAQQVAGPDTVAAAQDAEKTAMADAASLVEADKAAAPTPAEPAAEPAAKP